MRQSFPIMQEDKPVDLSKILSKCVTKDGIDDANEQPLYIDYERDVLLVAGAKSLRDQLKLESSTSM